jgi:hypothetical protein
MTVRYDPTGRMVDMVGETITVESAVAIEPALPVEEAVRRAARHVSGPDIDCSTCLTCLASAKPTAISSWTISRSAAAIGTP